MVSLTQLRACLGLTILTVLVISVNGTCDTGAADQCISAAVTAKNNLPGDNQGYCSASGAIWQTLTKCLDTKLSSCGSTTQGDYNSRKMQDVGNSIKNKCEGIGGCSNFLNQLTIFHLCAEDAEALATAAAQDWNSHLETKPACSPTSNDNTGDKTFREARMCFEAAVGSCMYMEGVFAQYMYSAPNVWMAYQACGSEKAVVAAQPSCSNRAGKEDSIKNQCKLPNIDWGNVGASTVCSEMQKQVDCMLREAAGCEELLDSLLKPRLDAYAMMNRLYLCNISIAAFKIYSVSDEGTFISCDFNKVLQCFHSFGITSDTPTGFLYNLKNLFELTGLSTAKCQVMRYYDFNEMESCLRDELSTCVYPFVTFRKFRELPDPVDFAPSLGPFLFNDVGLDVAGEYIHQQCFIDCQTTGSNSVYKKFMDECNGRYNLDSLANTIENRANSGIDVENERECRDIQDWVSCVNTLIQQCPALVDDVELYLSSRQKLDDAVTTHCRARMVLFPTAPTQAPITSAKPGTIITQPPTPSVASTSVVTTAKHSAVWSTIKTTTTTTKLVTTPKGFSHGTNPPTPSPSAPAATCSVLSLALCFILMLLVV